MPSQILDNISFDSQLQKNNRWLAFLLIFIALLGIIILLTLTKAGIGVSRDSINYISAARNLVDGNGLMVEGEGGKLNPLTQWGPLYPMTLAFIGLFGFDPLIIARYLNALLFGLTISLVVYYIYYLTTGAMWFSIIGGLILITSIPLLSAYTMAWSEPLFIFLCFSGLLILLLSIEKNNIFMLIVSSLLIALASLTRYAGVLFILIGAIMIWWVSSGTLRRKCFYIINFIAISSLPIFLWMLRNAYLYSNATNREITFHPINVKYLTIFAKTLALYLVPSPYSGIVVIKIRVVLLIIMITLIIINCILYSKHKNPVTYKINSNQQTINFVLLLILYCYIIFITICAVFIEANLFLDSRILLPVYLSGLIILQFQIYKIYYNIGNVKIVKFASILLLICITLVNCIFGIMWMGYQYDDAKDYASKSWKESKIIQMVKSLPKDVKIYTNERTGINFLTGKPAYTIPVLRFSSSGKDNQQFSDQLVGIKTQLENKEAVIVYFFLNKNLNFPSESELIKNLSLHLLVKEPDGAIYF